MAAPASTFLAPGSTVGRYESEGLLGASPTATVYRARHLDTGTGVALKRSDHLGDVARWEIEARLLSELHHPGVVLLLDHFEQPEGVYNIVTELIDGTDLARMLRDGGTPGLRVADVLRWSRDVCGALQYLHEQQVVHGDVQPRALVCTSERVVLVDFGLAARIGAGNVLRARGGTPRFMAPEVFAGEPTSPRSDVYSVAASAWTLISGTPPAYGEERTLQGIGDLTPELELALRAGLTFRPEERTESAAALAESLGVPIGQPEGASLAISAEEMQAKRPVLEAIVRAAAGVFDAAAASIALIEPSGGELTYLASWGAGANEVVGMKLEPGVGIAGAAAEAGKPQVVPNCRTDPRFATVLASMTGYLPHTMLVLPLKRDGVTVGVLSLLDRRDGEPYGPQDIPKGELLAAVAAASLA